MGGVPRSSRSLRQQAGGAGVVSVDVSALTGRQRDALLVLSTTSQRYRWSGAEFADLFWPGKRWRRGNHNYGLGPDGAAAHPEGRPKVGWSGKAKGRHGSRVARSRARRRRYELHVASLRD